jgi:leader peptidase (prepilin peptidase) / N-methyltransferase
MAAAVVFIGLFGLVVGSFLNVVAWRLPRGESLAHPPSHCPSCGHAVRPRDNIPVLSWLLLRGRCRDCGNPISIRYPIVEATTALLWVASALIVGVDEDLPLALALVTLLVPIFLIDLDHRIIPNVLVVPAAILAIALVAVRDPSDLPEHLIAGAGAFTFLLLAALAYPGGMGMGDVKLAGVLGLFLGTEVIPALLIAFLLGSIVGLVVIARKGAREGRKTAVPFGPFLAVGAVIALWVGADLIDFYKDNFL